MANDLKLTFSTGALSNLPSTFKAGQVLFAIDENNKGYIYFDKNSSTRVLMGSDSTYAEKANKDSNGNVIVSTYLTNLQGVKNTAETEYIIQGVRGDGSAPFNTSAVIPITLLSSENKTGAKLFLIGTTSQSSKGIVGYSNGNIYITTGNKLHANLEGKADTAAVADTANAIEWSKITSKPQLVEGFDGSSENNGYKIQLYNTSGSPIPAANTALNGTITIPFASANSIGLMSTDDQHFSGIKRFDDGINVEDLVPIESHTYTDVIGSANNNAGAGFFYAKVRGKTYNGVWHIKVRVKATVPSNANYETLSYFDLWGTANTYIAYKCQNAIKSTSYRPIYYHSYFRINQNGYNADLGGWLGFNLIYSANPTNTSFKRTVTIDLLMYENCDVEFVSTLLEPADIPNVTVTGNYSSSTTSYDNFDCCNNGLRETGDDNDTTTMVSPYNRFMAGAGGLMRYSLAMRDTTGRWQSFTTGTGGNSNTPKSKNTAKFIMGDIVYLSMGSDVANGNLIGTSVVRHYQSLIDYRYSTNAGSATLVANKTVYIVGTVDEDGLFSLDDTWWTQDLPTSEDGKVYIPLGVVYNDSSTYRCDFSGWHTPLIYRNGKIVSYTDTIDISHTTGILLVHRGGTGRVSFTAGELLMGNGSDALSSVAKTSANTANTVVYRDANGNFSAGTITANLTGTATKATQDSAGQQINTTYIKGLSISGTTLTITKGNGGTSTLTLQDFDTKVGMIARGTTKAYVLGTITTPTDSNQNITSVAETGVYFDTVAGQLVATNFKGNLIGNADTATKATKDSANQQINTTYIKGLSASSVAITVTKGDGSTSTFDIGALPLSGGTMTGNILAGGTQSLGSTSNPFHNLVLGGTTSATMTNASTNPRITFQEGTGTQPVHLIYSDYDNYRSPAGLKVVGGASATPAWFEVEGNVYAAAFKGNADSATKATQDSAGQQINTTYIKGLSVSGKTITITKGDGSTSTITTQDTNTDTKVNVKLATTTKAYLLATSTTPTSSNQAVESVADSGVYLDTAEGTLTATTFKGALQGNADTATKATGDSAGQQINTTYIKDLSISGTTITVTKGDGSTSTLTTQDNNTDTKVNVTLGTTTKAYLLGTSTTPTATAQGVTAIADTGIYLDTTAGQLVATTFKGALDGNAATATKALKDNKGQQIDITYYKDFSVNGTTITFTRGDGDTNKTLTIAALPLAGGIMTGAIKRYYGSASTDPMISLSSNDKDAILFQVGHNTSATPSTGNYYKLMYKGSGSSPNNLLQLIAAKNTSSEVIAIKVDENGNVTFANTVTANISGSAASATKDSAGQQINTTYIKDISVSGTTLTITKGNGGTSTLTLQDLDTKVGMVARGTTKAYILGTITAPTTNNQNVTSVAETGVYFDTTAAKLVATTFKGALEGNADTATKATKDSAGQQINTTYIKNISINGTTLTITKGNGDDTNLTLQDFDVKVNMKARGTTKAYLLGTITSPTSNDQAVTSVAETGVYLDAAGTLNATTFKGNLAWSYLTSVPQIVEGALGSTTTNGYKIQLYNLAGGVITSTTNAQNGVITIPLATTSSLGLVSTAAQSFAGDKTFIGVTTLGRNIFRNRTDVPEQGEAVLTALGFKTGYPVYTDPLFTTGTNEIKLYNNSNSTAPYTSITRMTYTEAGLAAAPGTGSNYVIRIQNTGTGTSPGLGGFYQTISARANAVFVQIFRALVPIGYNLATASNFMGTGYKDEWITSNAGTGKWEWYARRVLCGSTGLFSGGGHVSLSSTNTTIYPFGTTDNPINWYLSYCNLYDLTKAQYDGLRTRYADDADNAAYAEKALKDNKGQQIDTTYIKNIVTDIANHKLTFTNGFGSDTECSLGFVKCTGDTMSGSLYISATDTGERFVEAGNSNGKVRLLASTNRGLYDVTKSNWIIYRAQAGTTTYIVNNGYTWTYTSDGKFDAPGDPGENANLIGTASRAVGDSKGQAVTSYIRDLSISGRTITITKGDGTAATITTQDTNTDTKVNVTLDQTHKAYLLGTTTTPTSTATGVTAVADTAVYLDTAVGALTATTFKGNLAWTYLTSVPQIIEGALGTWGTTGYQIQLYNLAGGAIASSTVATNGIITVPFAANNTAGLISTDEQTLSGIKHIDTSGSSIGASKYYQFTTTVGKTHIGWVKFAQLDLNTSNHFGAHQFDIFISRSYNSPAPETYALRVSVSWSRCQIIQLGGDWWGHIITHFRVVKDNTNHKVYFEYYVSEAGTSSNTGYIRIIQRFGSYTLIPLNEVQTEQDTDFANKWDIELSRDGIVANLIGNASTATLADSAVKDESGNNIKSYYAHSLSGAHTSTNKNEYILTLANSNGTALSTVTLPLATDSQAGLLSFANQTIKGIKTFSTGIVAKTDNDFISHSNEFNFAPALSANMEIHINHRTAGTNTNSAKITKYHFKDGNGQYTVIKASSFEGTVDWSNIGSKPQAVEGAVGTKATDKYTIQLYDLAGGAIAANTATPAKNGVIVIPAASTTDAGLVTTGTQTFTGAKTFNTSIGTPTLTVTGTGGLNYSGIQNGTTNVARVVWFADASYKGKPVYHTDFTYNPATGELKAGKFTSSGTMSGTALTLSLGDDSMHSTEDATLKVTGGASISERLSAKMIRIDNGVADATKGFNLIYNSTEECLEFQFGN